MLEDVDPGSLDRNTRDKDEVPSMLSESRQLRHRLHSQVPFGGGLIPKAGIAYAGTFAVGVSLERLYRLGYGFTRSERSAVYEEAFEHGRQIAGMLLDGLRQRKAAVNG